MQFRLGERRGISRPEILFVISVLLGLVSLLVPALLEIGQRNRSIKAYSDMRALVSAATRYNTEYRLWPAPEPPARGDARYGSRRSNAPVIRILRALEGEGNEQHRANLSRIDFIAEASTGGEALSWNENGEVVDPWGTPYELVFDSNYDSICNPDSMFHSSVVGEGIIVWSCGPDRKTETRDDLRSWMR